MNIERIPERLLRWGVITAGLALAVVAVRSAAHGDYGKVAMMFLAIVFTGAILGLRERLWMAIPIFWCITGEIPSLPLPFSVRDIVTVTVFTGFLVLRAFKVVRRGLRFKGLDLLLFFILFYMTIGFVRNPVGLDALDSERVGGRPYFTVFIAFLAYCVLSSSSLGSRAWKPYPEVLTAFRCFDGVMTQILMWLPALAGFVTAYYVGPFFLLVTNPEMVGDVPGAESTKRVGYLMPIGQSILIYLFAKASPLAAFNIARPWRMGLLLLGTACVLLSGFRSSLALCIGVGLISAFVHGGRKDFVRVLTIGFVGMFILALGNNSLFRLPSSAQRALSFLPGNWDQVSINEAKHSTEWRFQMWEQMLTTNRYIENHWLGDGYGFRKRDLEQMRARRVLTLNVEQEDFMLSGAVHSGPVSAIRVVGYIGLAFYLVLLGGLAVKAWKLIRQLKGTSFQTLGFIFCFPAVVEPFYFVFVFGSFDGSLAESIFLLGILNLIQNTLSDGAVNDPGEKLDLPEIANEAVTRTPAGGVRSFR